MDVWGQRVAFQSDGLRAPSRWLLQATPILPAGCRCATIHACKARAAVRPRRPRAWIHQRQRIPGIDFFAKTLIQPEPVQEVPVIAAETVARVEYAVLEFGQEIHGEDRVPAHGFQA